MVYVAREKSDFVDKLHLKQTPVGSRMTLWSDLGDSRGPFVSIIREFVERNPVILLNIEMCDLNRFDTRNDCRYVARFEFRVIGEVREFVNEGLVDFCLSLSDAFVLAKLPPDIQGRNERLREKLQKEKEGEKEKEKKLTPEEEEKIQRKRERREEKRLTPRIKMVKQ
jgi:hypothetical protein